jgi:hypothetical protein
MGDCHNDKYLAMKLQDLSLSPGSDDIIEMGVLSIEMVSGVRPFFDSQLQGVSFNTSRG